MRNLVLIFASVVFLSACQASTTRLAVQNQAIAVKPNQATKAIAFEGIAINIPRGETIGKVQGGVVCIGKEDLKIKTGRFQVDDEMFSQVFRDELKTANYKIIEENDNFFQAKPNESADYLIAGQITDIEANICYPNYGFFNLSMSSGSAYLKVNWQVFDNLNKEVVYNLTTEGSYKTKGASSGGENIVIEHAFSSAINNLLADAGFHKLMIIGDEQ